MCESLTGTSLVLVSLKDSRKFHVRSGRMEGLANGLACLGRFSAGLRGWTFFQNPIEEGPGWPLLGSREGQPEALTEDAGLHLCTYTVLSRELGPDLCFSKMIFSSIKWR